MASDGVISVAQGAQLIASHQGRSYSYQALKYLMEKGRLPMAAILDDNGKAVGVRRDVLIEEFESVIGTRQAIDQKRRERIRTAEPLSQPVTSDDEPPDYNTSRALREHQLALMAQMDRRQREGELLERVEVEKAWGQSVAIVKTALLGVPSKAKERIPHLTLEEIEVITILIRDALEEVANDAA